MAYALQALALCAVAAAICFGVLHVATVPEGTPDCGGLRFNALSTAAVKRSLKRRSVTHRASAFHSAVLFDVSNARGSMFTGSPVRTLFNREAASGSKKHAQVLWVFGGDTSLISL